MNLVEELYRSADRGNVALIDGGTTLRFGELFERVEKAAAEIGKTHAPRVALECPNGIQHIVLALAIVRAGKCLIPIASELAPPERDRLIRETGVGAIVDGAGKIRKVSQPSEHAFEGALAAINPAFIRFSSGTTGASKGVVLSHETLRARIDAANRGLQISEADRVLWILPMAHHFAVSIMLYLLQGAATVIANSHLAEDILAAADQTNATVIYGSPFHHATLAGDTSEMKWPSLRLAVSTAAALSASTAEKFVQRFRVPLSQGFGIIEIGLPLLNRHAQIEKPESVGRPLPDYEVRFNETGELLVRGPGMFEAYLSPWRPRSSVLEEGWFNTGDVARIDSDGDVFLLGRSKAVINVAGLKCFPEEIESVLREAPGVKAVRVFGKPNSRSGAVPAAEIIPADFAKPPSIAALVQHCRKALARYKIPVEFRMVEALPLTASGKLKR